MTYKTIIVQLNDDTRAAQLLEPASALAEKFGAHLIGLHVSQGLMYVPPLRGAGGIVAQIKEQERQAADRIARVFEDATRARGFAAEMRFLNPRAREDAGSLVIQNVRSADLVIASQSDGSFDASSLLDMPERLAMESGRPVLMVPLAGAKAPIGRKALVAWNGSREAARAVFDAMPLLKGAKVTVLGIEQVRSKGDADPLPDTEIGATLARHGIDVTVKTASASALSIGEEILAQVTEEGADLLVMGAYGRTRFREIIFGGATRHLARHLAVPTLLSH